MAHYLAMVFVETSLFSKLLARYLTDEDYRNFQNHIALQPEVGDLIRGSGGVRKVRWGAGGKGKSGGVRVIYYWAKSAEQTFLLTIYGKGEKESLSASDLKKVVKLVEELLDD
jgi:mRNA-degrading endonuclease RelE of RelBE toxin-antitoxin system